MNRRQKQAVEALQRAQEFVVTNPVAGPGGYGDAQTLLDDVIAQLTEHTTDQVAGVRLGRSAADELEAEERALRQDHLVPISRIAGSVLRGSPGMDKAVKMPKSPLPTQKLLADARSFREAASLYEDVFKKNGRPDDFLARLDAQIALVQQVFLKKAKQLGTRVGATRGVADEIKRGRDAVRMLDATVQTAFADKPFLLATWRSARRIRALGSTAHGSTSDQSASSTSAAATAAAAPAAPAATNTQSTQAAA